tara:strand:+ start:114 stop:293 length:180 start_codon:yes stop_codon:yes gene_type:complete
MFLKASTVKNTGSWVAMGMICGIVVGATICDNVAKGMVIGMIVGAVFSPISLAIRKPKS